MDIVITLTYRSTIKCCCIKYILCVRNARNSTSASRFKYFIQSRKGLDMV